MLVTGAGTAGLARDALGGSTGRVAVVPAGALSSPGDVVPMAGRWDAEGDALRFTPRLPFARGTVHVLVRAGAGATDPPTWVELARLERPAAGNEPTTAVTAIHPDVMEVPENLLRLSVGFSAGMAEGGAAGRVHVVDREGQDLEHALLPMPPELWDRPRRRLTLLLEPGRIKRGLAPNRALGAPLTGLRGFALVVDADVRDAAGDSLVAGHRRDYRVGPPVRTRVDPSLWRISWPEAGAAEPLVVCFERPLDHALALRCLRVSGQDGAVPGVATLDRGETRWSFTPREPWPAGPLRLHVDAAVEDLAGNSVRRVLDRDLHLDRDDPLAVSEVVLRSDRPGR